MPEVFVREFQTQGQRRRPYDDRAEAGLVCVPVRHSLRHSQSTDPSQKLGEKRGVVFPRSFQKDPTYQPKPIRDPGS